MALPIKNNGTFTNQNDDMKYDPRKHHRRSIRLPQYDYTQPGGYFITVCTTNRECLFGKIRNGTISLNEYGTIVRAEWERTAIIRPNVVLDAFVVMPNHVHGIIILNDDRWDTLQRDPLQSMV